MVVGTTLFRLDGSAYYSPEFGRGGLGATFVVEVLNVDLSASQTFDIDIESRNADQVSWTPLASFTGMTAAGVFTKDVSDPLEILRLKFSFSGTTASDAAHFLVQAPSWRPY